MPTRVLEFRLGRPDVLPDLIHEFNLDTEVSVSVRDQDVLVVEINDTASAAWSVRATLRSFDETAVEL